MSLTDQDRIEMAADNCEVLRARLAKYEDADGNPKDKPSGVVPAALGSAFITCESGDAGYRVVIKSEKLQESQQVHNWLVFLNSSPVIAGDPEKCSYQDDPRSPAELSLAGCNCVRFGEGNPHWPCKLHSSASVGGVDERAADALDE
jgi:hypothetical protein